ncbi:unnamed protein product [Ranitomeya imitator]|uniref:CBM21 domain-containing protein n=1 Tax=Ranitomeya imitator TaxID=111125 RepID=A0ABN9LUV6_9NEOB|nr:unnamed protein product [Ranitomeya imitator]
MEAKEPSLVQVVQNIREMSRRCTYTKMSRPSRPPCGDIPRNLSYIAGLYERAYYRTARPSLEEHDEEEEGPSCPGLSCTVKTQTAPRRWRSRSAPALRVSRVERHRSPETRKRVRFADALGLELESVRHFRREDLPCIPQHVTYRLQKELLEQLGGSCIAREDVDAGAFNNYLLLCGSVSSTDAQQRARTDYVTAPSNLSVTARGRCRRSRSEEQSWCEARHALSPSWIVERGTLEKQSWERSAWDQETWDQRVCLQSMRCESCFLWGSVRVLDLAYEKRVTVRYSLNKWLSYQDTHALYAARLCHGGPGHPGTDLFTFRLPLPQLDQPQSSSLEFAVCYQVGDQEFWDNNTGRNYSLVRPETGSSRTQESENGWIHFI